MVQIINIEEPLCNSQHNTNECSILRGARKPLGTVILGFKSGNNVKMRKFIKMKAGGAAKRVKYLQLALGLKQARTHQLKWMINTKGLR